MLRQEELAFIMAISKLQLSPALLKQLRMALFSWKKMPAISARSRSTAPGVSFKASQIPRSQQAGKRKANELAN
jgi:hypothetical protein